LYCLDIAAGDVRWRRDFGLGRIGAVWCELSGDRLVAYWDQGVLCAMRASTGEPLWDLAVSISTRGGEESTGTSAFPCIIGDLVFTWEKAGPLVARRAADGSEVWRLGLAALVGATLDEQARLEMSAVVVKGSLLVTVPRLRSMSILVRPTDGHIVWRRSEEQAGTNMVVDAVGDPPAIVMQIWDRLMGIDLEKGTTLWSLPIGNPSWGMRAATVGDLLLISRGSECLVISHRIGGIVARVPVGGRGYGPTGMTVAATPQGIRLYTIGRGFVSAWDVTVPAAAPGP
jgi:outer membrane protein assembly factor BamB